MIPVGEGSTAVGRAPDNAIQFAEGTVSRHHARLEGGADGVVRLVDLGSTNGTLVNKKRVARGQAVLLKDGDRIQFGPSHVVKFIRPDACEERFQRELFERGVRDSLTGLYNRAYFLDQVGPLAGRATLRGLGLAIMMLDVDYFKRVNDNHGHVAGDLVLREVAEVLRHSTRPDDLVARYGGEEFMVAVPLSGAALAVERAERIRHQIASRPVWVGDHALSITISVGLSYAQPGLIRPLAMVASADRQLYRAKNAGRNQVMSTLDDQASDLEALTCEESVEMPVAVASDATIH
jgi:diguanylate cyclase (GGDEF)-like protein